MILVVEDNEDDVFILRRAFKAAEVDVPIQIATDGALAIQYLAGESEFSDRESYPFPKFVLLDIQLPRLTGLEVLEWIRRSNTLNRLPVLMLTSSSQPSDIRRAYDLGANAYLVKPTNLEQLSKMVASIKAFWLDHNQY